MLTAQDKELFKLQAELCKAFSDPKRLIIINELRKGQQSVTDLVNTLKIPQAAVSRHLAVLRERGVVESHRKGTNVYYEITDDRICDACDMVHQILLARIRKNHRLINNKL